MKRGKNKKLWLAKPWIEEHETELLDCYPWDDKWMLLCPDSIFFPGGGGQEADTGLLNDQELIAVRELEGGIGHLVAKPPKGSSITMVLDRDKRLQAARKHSAQHIISAWAYRELGLQTTSVHFSDQEFTVDLDCPSLSDKTLTELEKGSNEICRKALEIETHLLEGDEVKSFEKKHLLRKSLPQRNELSIVEIQDFDAVPCCGTHLSSTAQASPIVLLALCKVKRRCRLTFVCGNRALDYCRDSHRILTALGEALNAPRSKVLEQCHAKLDEARTLRNELNLMEEDYLKILFEREALAKARHCSGLEVIVWQNERLRNKSMARLAEDAAAKGRRIVILAKPQEGAKAILSLSCSRDLEMNCSKVLQGVLHELGGKGGGKSNQAQGTVENHRLSQALEELQRVSKRASTNL